MGFTASRFERAADTTWANALMGRIGFGSQAGQNVSKATVATIPALSRAWNFAANSVAVLSAGVYHHGKQGYPEKVLTVWQSRLFKGVPNPNQSWRWFWFIVQKSIEARYSAYVWKTFGSDGRVKYLTALHPDQVFCYRQTNGRMGYSIVFNPWYPRPPDVDNGTGSVPVDSSVLMHIRGDGGIGELIPPTPIQQFATTHGIALAKQDYEANLYENGVMGGLAVTFPSGMTSDQAKQWKQVFDSENAGAGNTGRTKVVGGGATLAQIGMTLADAQFVEAGKMSLVDVANMTGVPMWVVSAADKGDKAKPEEDEARWAHHGLLARLVNLQSAFTADPDIFGPDSPWSLMFDSEGSIHPDMLTSDTIAHQQIQDGRITANEWRASRGLDPVKWGDEPVATPVGGAPNPGLSQPEDGNPNE